MSKTKNAQSKISKAFNWLMRPECLLPTSAIIGGILGAAFNKSNSLEGAEAGAIFSTVAATGLGFLYTQVKYQKAMAALKREDGPKTPAV